MKRSSRHLTLGAIAAGIAVFAGSAIVAGAGTGDDGTVLVPAVPVRILDTRLGSSSIKTLHAGEEATVSFAQVVPAGTRAVDINVTTTAGTEPSFLAVYPTGMQRPITSAVNWNGPTSQANSIAVKVNNNYEIDIYNAFGNVDVVIDMMGYYIDAPTGNGTDGRDGLDGVDGQDGAPGVQGPPGDVGATGPAGASNVEIYYGQTMPVNEANSPVNAFATCVLPDEVALGGGYETSNATNSSGIAISNSFPSLVTQWKASGAVVIPGTTYSLRAYVICATSTPIP